MGSTNSKRVSDAHKAKVETLNATPEPAAKKAQKDKNRKVIEAAALVKADDQIKRFAELKQSQIELLDGIANAVTAELTTLQTLAEANRLAREELESIHGIIAEANSLSALQLAHEDERNQFEKNMSLTREEWTAQEKQLFLDRKREQENYQYVQAQTRRKDADAWEQEKQARVQTFEAELKARTQTVERQENEVQAIWAELVELREKAQTADARQEAEVKKQVAIATSSLKKDLEYSAALERLKLENANALLQQAILDRGHTIAELTKQLDAMTAKYQEAALRVQQIAERAVDATASRPNYFTAPVANGNDAQKRN